MYDENETIEKLAGFIMEKLAYTCERKWAEQFAAQILEKLKEGQSK